MGNIHALLARARELGRPLLMGVVNTTPDSFFDGGRAFEPAHAERRIDALVEAGVDIIDIGAESSKPGAPDVSAEEQLRRLGHNIEYALRSGTPVSIDTTNSGVADATLARGAQMVNDVSCLRNPGLAEVVARHDAWLVITHSRSPMSEMKGFSRWPDDDYPDIVMDVAREWARARRVAVQLGVDSDQIIFDPGLGFSKNARHSFTLLAKLRHFRNLHAPILVGPGRKSFIAAVDASTPEQRLGGTLAASLLAAMNGADLLRVHDVFEVRQALRVLEGVMHPDAIGNEARDVARDDTPKSDVLEGGL